MKGKVRLTKMRTQRKSKKASRKRTIVLLVFGVFCISLSIGLAVYNTLEERAVGVETAGVMEVLENTPPIYNVADISGDLEAIPDYILNPTMEMPTVEVDGHLYIGRIQIPSAEIDLPVMSEWSYPNLKIAPCRYLGSIYTDDAIIMAHNYRIHFKCLWNITEGTEIKFVDVDGNVFNYEVAWVEEIATDNLDSLLSETPDWDLTLFTCTYGGQTRIVARCNRVF